MRKIKDLMKNKKSLLITLAMFVAAIALILTSTIGGSRAALTYFSETYAGHVEMYDIGVTLVEECDKDTAGHDVSYRNYIQNSNGNWNLGKIPLLEHMLGEGESLQLGKTYKEVLSVRNSGTINEFVRVTVYKYWVDKNGQKVTTLTPDLIDLHWTNLGSDWLIASETEESIVMYYNKLLYSGASTAPFTDTLTVYIDDTLLTSKAVQNGNVITYTYDYDGYKFQIEAEVDAVQEHNAQDAILSAWGTNVSVMGNSLSLN